MSTSDQAPSLYEVLEVEADATTEEIEESYLRIVTVLESGSLALYSMVEEGDVDRLRSQVDEAYDTLSDPERRAAYDEANEGGGGHYPAVLVPEQDSGSSVSVGRMERTGISSAMEALAEPRDIGVATAAAAVRESADRGFGGEDRDSPQEVAREKPRLSRTESEGRADGNDRPFGARASDDAGRAASRPPGLSRSGDRCGPPVRSARRRFSPCIDIQVTPDTEFSGALLRRLRESAGASIGDVADLTKIGKRYLAAIEANDFDTLPASVYVRGFVSEYARVLGLDARVVAKSYMSLYQRYRGEGG